MLKTPEERQTIAGKIADIIAGETVTYMDAKDIMLRVEDLISDQLILEKQNQ